MLGRASLALDEAAGNLARGVHALLDIDRQREEVDALARRLARGGGAQDDGIAVAQQHGAAGLFGDAARLDGQCAATDRGLNLMNHVSSCAAT